MKIKELINALSRFDENLEICIALDDEGHQFDEIVGVGYSSTPLVAVVGARQYLTCETEEEVGSYKQQADGIP